MPLSPMTMWLPATVAVMVSAPSPPMRILLPDPAVMRSLPPRSMVPPPALVCDFVATRTNSRPAASISTTPLSPRMVSVPSPLMIVSSPMPPSTVLLPLPSVMVSLPPVDAIVSVVSK